MRCASAVLAEAEAAIATHNKILGIKRSQFAQCENKLTELKEQKVIVITISLNIKHASFLFTWLICQEVCLFERKNQMIFKLGNIQIPLTGAAEHFDGTMMLSKNELALTNSMIQVNHIHLIDKKILPQRAIMLVTHNNL